MQLRLFVDFAGQRRKDARFEVYTLVPAIPIPATKRVIPSLRKTSLFYPDPVCIGVAGGDLRTSPKEAFGRAFEESLHEIGCNSHIDAGLLHPADVLPLGSPSFPIALLKTRALATVYENVAPHAWSSPNFLHGESKASAPRYTVLRR
jgi:hypothetical protein